MFSEPWWVAHLRWFVVTEHPWDVALHFEAMTLSFAGLSQQVRDILTPAIERLGAALQKTLAIGGGTE